MKRRTTITVWALRLGLLAAIAAAWAVKSDSGVSSVVLPSMGSVAASLATTVQLGSTWTALGQTLLEVILALAIAVIAGFAIGFVASRRPLSDRVVQPLVGWAYMVPLVLFYPLFVLWFGAGIESKIAYGACNAFLPVAFSTMSAFRSVDPGYLHVARAFNATPAQTDWLVKLPGSLPVVVAGIRAAAALTLISVVLAEMLVSTGGVGYQLARASDVLDASSEFAYVVLILALVLVVQTLIRAASSMAVGGPRRPR